MDNAPSLKWPKWVFPALLMSFLACILLIADWTYWREYSLIRAEKIAELKSISRMKCDEILSWRKERITDAVTEAADPFLRSALANWISHPTNLLLKRDISKELRDEFSSNQYLNAFITNSSGKILLTIHPMHGGLGIAGNHLVGKAISKRHAVFGDFTKDPRTGDIHIDLTAPILGPRGNPVAALMLRLNPQATIYPLIETWPTESKTTETLLVEKQGDDAVFLNTVRHSTLPPMSMRIPVTRINIPAIRAVLGGTGIYEGPDYRGSEVVADICPLQSTPWYLVTKVDKSIILADVRYWRDVVIVVALLAMVVACIGTALLYIHHDRVLYRAYYHSERERASALEEIRATLYHIGDGVIATDAMGCVTRMNPEAETLTGRSEKDAIGRPLQEVFNIINEDTRMKVDNPASTVLKNGAVVGLANHTTLIAKDGSEKPIADSGAPIRNSEGDITGVVIVFRDQTEERRKQSERRASEIRYRNLFESSPIPLLEIDLTRIDNHLTQIENNGITDIPSYFMESPDELKKCERMLDILNANSTALKMFGVNNPDELINNLDRFFTDELHEVFLEGMISVYLGCDEFQKDSVCRNKTGENIPISLSFTATLDEFEKTPRLVLALVDLSPRKQMEEAREASNRLFRQLFTDNVAPHLLIDIPAMQILDANWAASRFYGYSIEELKGMHITNINTTSMDEIRSLVKDAASGEKNLFITRHRIASGEMRDVEVLTSPFMYENRIVLHFIIHDITVQRRLQDYNRWLASIVEHAINEVYVIDMETLHFGYVNRAAQENLGYTFEEMRKLTPMDIKPEFTKERFMQTLAPLLSDETTSLELETLHLRRDGTSYPAWLSLKKMDMGDKRTIIVIGQNITEYKRMEDQLRQAHKMESVGRLAGGVAHDFNNMLGVILGHAEMALERIDRGKPVRDNLNEILKAAKRSADLTRQLLAFARRQTINPVVLDLNETVAGMLKMLRRLIGENIELIWKPERSLWQVKIDPAQVDQTLMNLIVNARDAISDVGSITIETSHVVLDEVYSETHAGAPPGEYVLLAVSDTGMGMDKETLDHIFEPFYSTKEVGKGTGLGLSMIYGIVKQNHGYLTVYSEQGNGACFKIYLPRTHDSKADMKDAANDKVTTGVETVLVVEDEEAILNLSRDVLEQQGYMVIAVSTANEAIHYAETHSDPIHLLITDIVMPDMNGKELAERISAIRPKIKVLYMSGYTASSIEHRGVLDEGMHYLPKPFSIRTFAEKVRETLDS